MPPVNVRECVTLAELERHGRAVETVVADRQIIAYAVALADATRHPEQHQLRALAPLIEFGSSPRGPIGLVEAARALALLRGRAHVDTQDVHDLAADVLRHRIVLSYDALSDGVTVDQLLERILDAVPAPDSGHLIRAAAS